MNADMRYVVREVANPFTLLLWPPDNARLHTTCFRPGVNCAGNFGRWRWFGEIMADPVVRPLIIAQIDEGLSRRVERGAGSRISFTITNPSGWVGWRSTVPLSSLPEGISLVDFNPNKHTSAKQVSDPTVLSPRTDEFTVVVTLEQRPTEWWAVIRTTYPGPEVRLGRKSIRRKIILPEDAVFFPWGQQGAVGE